MRLCSFRSNNRILAGVIVREEVLAVSKVNRELGSTFATTLPDLIAQGHVPALRAALESTKASPPRGLPLHLAPLCVPYTTQKKIWGVSANDWAAEQPDAMLPEAVGFFKPTTALIGPNEPIVFPAQVARVSAEIALGIILGKTCTRLTVEAVPEVVLGLTTLLDLTAVELVQHSPWQLASAKSFDTSLSLGPWVVTPDEVAEVSQLSATILRNGEPQHSSRLDALPVSPYDLLAAYSTAMTWHAGDIFFCTLPGKVILQPGDHVTCEINGLGILENFVAAVPPPSQHDIP